VKSPIDAGTLLMLAEPKRPRRKRKMRRDAALFAKAAPKEKAEQSCRSPRSEREYGSGRVEESETAQ